MNKPSKTIIVFLLFGAIPVSTVVWDIVNYLFITHQLPIVQIYALPFMFILFMVLQIADTLKQELKLSELKKELSKRDVQDTKTEKKFSLTSSMEEKLLKLKEFINDNYDSPISREGIAEALDLSPDYMSRMFKAHTGQKINDYINELRIESAGRQLLESNKKIIDIAFSVGFESLVTFNRAFSKIKKTSPSKYRQTGGKPE
jgi:transcriptional regulator GlxA family with amidase domain